jgi:hypothetical protein
MPTIGRDNGVSIGGYNNGVATLNVTFQPTQKTVYLVYIGKHRYMENIKTYLWELMVDQS